MKYAQLPFLTAIRGFALVLSLVAGAAYADDYADVSQLVRNGNLQEALSKADQFLVGKPRDPQMRFLKGVIQRDLNKTSDAIHTFTKLTEEYPELPEPHNNLAVLYAGQAQYDKARTALEMAIRTNPSYATAHENLGDIYAKLASQAYGKALQLDSNNQAIPPKLGLIRELFNPVIGKTQRPTSSGMPGQSTSVSKNSAPSPEPVNGKSAVGSQETTNRKQDIAAPPPVATPASSAASASGSAPQGGAKSAPSDSTAPAAEAEVEGAVRNWAKAWESRDVKSYLAAYGKEFVPPGGLNRSTWEDERRVRILSKSKISVRIGSLKVAVNGNKASAQFRQDYKANELAVSSRKTLDFFRSGDRWLIVRETVMN